MSKEPINKVKVDTSSKDYQQQLAYDSLEKLYTNTDVSASLLAEGAYGAVQTSRSKAIRKVDTYGDTAKLNEAMYSGALVLHSVPCTTENGVKVCSAPMVKQKEGRLHRVITTHGFAKHVTVSYVAPAPNKYDTYAGQNNVIDGARDVSYVKLFGIGASYYEEAFKSFGTGKAGLIAEDQYAHQKNPEEHLGKLALVDLSRNSSEMYSGYFKGLSSVEKKVYVPAGFNLDTTGIGNDALFEREVTKIIKPTPVSTDTRNKVAAHFAISRTGNVVVIGSCDDIMRTQTPIMSREISIAMEEAACLLVPADNTGKRVALHPKQIKMLLQPVDVTLKYGDKIPNVTYGMLYLGYTRAQLHSLAVILAKLELAYPELASGNGETLLQGRYFNFETGTQTQQTPPGYCTDNSTADQRNTTANTLGYIGLCSLKYTGQDVYNAVSKQVAKIGYAANDSIATTQNRVISSLRSYLIEATNNNVWDYVFKQVDKLHTKPVLSIVNGKTIDQVKIRNAMSGKTMVLHRGDLFNKRKFAETTLRIPRAYEVFRLENPEYINASDSEVLQVLSSYVDDNIEQVLWDVASLFPNKVIKVYSALRVPYEKMYKAHKASTLKGKQKVQQDIQAAIQGRNKRPSQHVLGLAMDIMVEGVSKEELFYQMHYTLKYGIKTGGAGYYPNSKFNHFDRRYGAPAWWIDVSSAGDKAAYLRGSQLTDTLNKLKLQIESAGGDQKTVVTQGDPRGSVTSLAQVWYSNDNQYALSPLQGLDKTLAPRTEAALRINQWLFDDMQRNNLKFVTKYRREHTITAASGISESESGVSKVFKKDEGYPVLLWKEIDNIDKNKKSTHLVGADGNVLGETTF